MHRCTGVSGEEGAAVGKGWKWWTQGGRENHVLIREFCGTDHITPLFQGMGDLLIACIPGLQKNSAKQWGPADFGASEVYTGQVPGFLSSSGPKPSSCPLASRPPLGYPILALLSSRLQLCQQNTHSPLDLSSVSRRKQPD